VASAADVEREIDRLYTLPLDEFVDARNELAKQVRGDGERAVSARIKELRKPTLSAWTVNRLVRERELDVQRLLKAGEQLTEAQLGAVAGGDPDRFAAARQDEQEALALLTRAARELLTKEGRGTSAVDRVAQTLRAAAATEEGRKLLKSGRLTDDLDPVGFDAFTGRIAPAEGRSARARKSDSAAAKRREAETVRRRIKELEQEERRLSRLATAAAKRAEKAERQAERLRAEADRAEQEAAAAATALDEEKARSSEP
jgi:hypothetical protein